MMGTRGDEKHGRKQQDFSYNRRGRLGVLSTSVHVYNLSIQKHFALRQSVLVEYAKDLDVENMRLLEPSAANRRHFA